MRQRGEARRPALEQVRVDASRTPTGASVLLVCVLLAALFAVRAAGAPSHAKGKVRHAHVFEADRTGLAAPAGLAFSARTASFYVVESRRGAASVDTEIVRLTPFAASPVSDNAGSARIAAALRDPVNVTFDDRAGGLFLLDATDRVLEVRTGPDGRLDPATLARKDARLGLHDPQGLAVDATGVLYVLDRAPDRLVRVSFANGEATTSDADLSRLGLTGPRGLAFDPSSGHLHVRAGSDLVELTTTGELVATRDLSLLGLESAHGMTFAPSGDRTDAPETLSLYVADSGTARRPGSIVELSLAPLVEPMSGDFTSSVVNTVDLATLTPPSPDPSGIAYLPGERLMISDAEVEETAGGITHFQGANVWEVTASGSLVRTANISKVAPTSVPMTDEPTGVAFQASTGHSFFTEDGGKRVYNLNPGADGLVGTAGDTWTHFSTNTAGNTDPEGIAYDSFNDRLLVADGLNREIYQYTTTGAYIGQFDTLQHGVSDPESVEFNSVSGTLFVLSNLGSGPIIVETTIAGVLVQTIDISAAPLVKPAGLAYGPASDGSGEMRFYVIDRGIDNDENPQLVDGKLYELTAPQPGAPGNTPPTVSAGSDQSTTVSVPATLDATVADDGLPAPPSVTTSWSKQSGPGTVTFGDATAVDTTAAFSFAGTYVLRLTADDGALVAFDEVTVTVTPDTQGSALYLSFRDAATLGPVSAANEDVVYFDGTSFSLYFDGSDVAVGGLRIDAFARVDADTLLFSFDADKPVPGIGTVDDSDLVRFEATSLGPVTAGTFSLYFDGSDVGLTASGHDVTSVEPLPDGRILLSALGTVTVPGVAGTVTARDEDLLAFTPTTLGDATAGTFELYFDGSDVGLGESGEEVDGAAVDGSGTLYLSAFATFSVPGVSGDDEDVFVFTPTSLGSTTAGSYASTLAFDGSSFGVAANDVFAVDLP